MPIRATVWGENVHEQKNKAVAENYPKGMHGQIAALLNEDQNIQATTVTLQDPEHGMTEARLDETDVLLWWGHAAHDKVDDAIVERVVQRVWGGMGLIVLHSGHFLKVFKRLMDAPGALMVNLQDTLIGASPIFRSTLPVPVQLPFSGFKNPISSAAAGVARQAAARRARRHA